MKALGQHLLLELYGCDPEVLNDLDHIRMTMLEAVERINATIVDVIYRRFQPQGVTVVIAIAESHLSIHTWPEYGYAAVDVFSCGTQPISDPLVTFFVEKLRATTSSAVEVKRGMMAGNPPRELVAVGEASAPRS